MLFISQQFILHNLFQKSILRVTSVQIFNQPEKMQSSVKKFIPDKPLMQKERQCNFNLKSTPANSHLKIRLISLSFYATGRPSG